MKALHKDNNYLTYILVSREEGQKIYGHLVVLQEIGRFKKKVKFAESFWLRGWHEWEPFNAEKYFLATRHF